MKTNTIQKIEEQVKQVEDNLKDFVLRRHKDEVYGKEEEYTPQSLKAAMNEIIANLRGLTNAHNKFLQLSTYDERNDIYDQLICINNALANKNYTVVVTQLDLLRSIIRSFGTMGSPETQEVLEERANRLNTQCSTAEENIKTIERIKVRAEEAEDKIQLAESKIKDVDNLLTESQDKSSQMDNLQNQSQESSQTIDESLAFAKSHAEAINNFVQRVQNRAEQLDKQEQKTTSYQEKLVSFEEEHKEKLREAEELINQARNALGYTTAEGISASFTERYLEEKENSKRFLWWLAGAALFVSAGIGIGIWLALNPQPIGLLLALSRITIMSLALSAAWFCASQYVRYRNTLDDYSYKSVLAKSMVAFLDQFKDPEERGHYLQTVLQEIHQDPLRKKHGPDDPTSEILRALRKGNKEKAKQPENQTVGVKNNE